MAKDTDVSEWQQSIPSGEAQVLPVSVVAGFLQETSLQQMCSQNNGGGGNWKHHIPTKFRIRFAANSAEHHVAGMAR